MLNLRFTWTQARAKAKDKTKKCSEVCIINLRLKHKQKHKACRTRELSAELKVVPVSSADSSPCAGAFY